MRTLSRALLLASLGLLGIAARSVAMRPETPACDGGRFVVREAALIAGATPGIPKLETIIISGGGIRISSGCSLVRAKLKRTRNGIRVRAKWGLCQGLRGRVRLTAMMDGCNRLRGMLKSKGARTPFVAELSACGDGIVDAEAGESCEPPGGAECDAGCQPIVEPPARCERPFFPSTWRAIQSVIIEQHTCTQSACHGSIRQGGLDLRPEVAYGQLVNAPSQAAVMDRVEAGDHERSLLWRKLAASTLGLAGVPLSPMPQGLPPLPANQLDALRLWIAAGAPASGEVAGTAALLDVCLPSSGLPPPSTTVPPPTTTSTTAPPATTTTTLPGQCGDGVVQPGEACDDGNDDDTDGCTRDCRLCSGNDFASTWEAIQAVIFARNHCTDVGCHIGATPTGELDLSGDPYTRLLDVDSEILPSLKRILPGDQDRSLLWLKLAYGTLGVGGVPGSPMPNGSWPPISIDELDALKLWIRAGAPATGTVAGTAVLLDACLPPPEPIEIPPPDPPAPDQGIQLHAPPWTIPPHSEDEVCFATYYDFEAQIQQARPDALGPCPAEWGEGRTCFYHHRDELTQDANSHHSIIYFYRGGYPISSFGPFTCHGGPMNGQTCDPVKLGIAAPVGADCGPGGGCSGQVVSTIACNFNYGPPDFGFNLGSGTPTAPMIGGSQEPRSVLDYPPGASVPLPTKGIVVWNSHAFNLFDEPAVNRQWLNLYFAGPADREYLAQGLFNAGAIFAMNVPPFKTQEVCNTHTLDRGTRLFQLSTHSHKRGNFFRVWGPPNTPCAPGPLCTADTRAPLLTTTVYSDPAVLYFDPVIELDGTDVASRTLKYCSLYDNGATDPAAVKRQSTSPSPPLPLGLGGPCSNSTVACMAGPRKGLPCHGDNARCDTLPAQGDGVCDACPLTGGVTTEDEMFILLGIYYTVPVP